MTGERRFDRDLPAILADLYLESAPDYRNDIVRRIAITSQRPAWTFPERWLPMSAITLARQTFRPAPWRTAGLLALLALMLAAALALYVGSQQRLPPPFGPAHNGDLVLAEGGDLYLIDSATGAKTLAVGGPASETEPFFSRDGTRIAFFRESGTDNTLWVADDRGGAVRQLSTEGIANLSQIEWSPDGKSILLTTSVVGKSAPAIVPTDGSAPHVVEVDMPAESPIWLPSGEILFRGVQRTGFGLFAVRPDGTGIRTIVAPTGTNEWDGLFYAPSPDGAKIAYQWRDTDGIQKIYVIPLAGGTPQEVTTIESVLPIWSPDGRWISFLSENDFLYAVPVDGSQAPRLLISKVALQGLRWTPDSARILVVEETGRAVLLDPAGGPLVQATWTSSEMPDWQRLAVEP